MKKRRTFFVQICFFFYCMHFIVIEVLQVVFSLRLHLLIYTIKFRKVRTLRFLHLSFAFIAQKIRVI